MKKSILILIALALIALLAVPAAAKADLVIDSADLFTSDEEQILRDKAQALSDRYGMDVAIVTVWSLDGEEAYWYAEECYIDNLYGQGESFDGILFLISMEYRDWHILTCGNAVYVLTDYGIEQSFGTAAEYLAEDQWFYAFDAWLTDLERYFTAWENGSPIDGYIGGYDGPGTYDPIDGDIVYYDPPADGGDYVRVVFVSILIGAVVAFIVLAIMRSKMNTARKQSGATAYLENGSFQLTQNDNIFLYSNVTKIPINTDNGNGRGGGGSSVRSGGGGRSFGGGGGKF